MTVGKTASDTTWASTQSSSRGWRAKRTPATSGTWTWTWWRSGGAGSRWWRWRWRRTRRTKRWTRWRTPWTGGPWRGCPTPALKQTCNAALLKSWLVWSVPPRYQKREPTTFSITISSQTSPVHIIEIFFPNSWPSGGDPPKFQLWAVATLQLYQPCRVLLFIIDAGDDGDGFQNAIFLSLIICTFTFTFHVWQV